MLFLAQQFRGCAAVLPCLLEPPQLWLPQLMSLFYFLQPALKKKKKRHLYSDYFKENSTEQTSVEGGNIQEIFFLGVLAGKKNYLPQY